MSAYLFDQAWRLERQRLTALEHLLDPGTQRLLEELAPAPGARCLELGAGHGSIATWLARRGAAVVAVDADTRFLDEAAAAGVEVQRRDLASDPLPSADFDLVHARLLLVHLAGRDALLATMRSALRPGGAVLVEDFDWNAAAVHPASPVHERLVAAVTALQRDVGVDPYFGRTLPARLSAAGFSDVTAEGRIACGPGGSPESAAFRLTLEQLRPALASSGYLSDGELDAGLALLDDPAHTFSAPAVIAAHGRRPAESGKPA